MASRPKRHRADNSPASLADDTSDHDQQIPKMPRGEQARRSNMHTQMNENHHDGGTEDGTMLERGLIYFFYRPKVEETEAHGPDDVQKLYVVLSPGADVQRDTESATHKKRVIIIGSKRLPVIKESGRRAMTWGFVDTVSHDIKDIHKVLDPATYNTQTKGQRHLAGCRPCGEGVYAIYDYPKHTHLAYVLELPEHPGKVQEFFHIEPEGSYLISAKNSNIISEDPRGGLTASTERAKLPNELERTFEGRKWNKVNPVQLLDYPGVELLFIGVSRDIEKDLGDEGHSLEEAERADAKSLSVNKLFRELKMNRTDHSAQPLFGQWA